MKKDYFLLANNKSLKRLRKEIIEKDLDRDLELDINLDREDVNIYRLDGYWIREYGEDGFAKK